MTLDVCGGGGGGAGGGLGCLLGRLPVFLLYALGRFWARFFLKLGQFHSS
jgi:hypothetical protein